MDYGRRTNEMSQIMSGSGDAYKWLLHYNVTHITVPWEHRKLFNVEFLNAVGTRLTSNGRVTVYEIAREELATAGKPCDPAAPNLFEKECRAKGCMYLPRFNGAKCQLSHGLAAGEPVEDCGTGEKMTEESCHDKGCGWFPNYKGPWCHRSTHRPSATSRKQTFQPMSILTPDYDCGWHGMDVQQCVDRGCVWIPAGSNPWCTYKGPDSKTMDQINNVEPL
jgi:Trefoil (P-type) domain